MLFLLLIHITGLAQVLNESEPYLTTEDTCIVYQDKGVGKLEKVLNKESSTWFIDSKLLIYFGYDKAKTIFFF